MKKKLCLGILIFAILFIAGILLLPYLDVTKIELFVEGLPNGIKELALVSMITLQVVVAFLPGEPLELAAGYLCGAIDGTLVCIIGSLFGTLLVYFLVGIFKERIVHFFFSEDEITKVNHLLSKGKGSLFLLLIFLIPGTPKDIFVYLGSLSDIALPKWLFITSIGRIPSIVTSTFVASSFRSQDYITMGMTLLSLIAMSVIGLNYYQKLKEKD